MGGIPKALGHLISQVHIDLARLKNPLITITPLPVGPIPPGTALPMFIVCRGIQVPRGLSCVDGSCIARIYLMVWRGGRVQSCVRPVAAVHMTAGLDGMHGSGPTLLIGL